MVKLSSIKRYNRQILALIEKDLCLELRFKARIITRLINPFIQLLVLIFVFGVIFSIREGYSIGYWNSGNYTLFLLIAFSIQFSRSIIEKYNHMFSREKYWKTLSAIMVAPVNRFNLLIGTIGSELIMISIPLIILFIIAIILYPISWIYIFLVLLLFFSIYLIFASIGLIIGAFRISEERFLPYHAFLLRIIFLFSCINYPKEIFPKIIQYIVVLNPLYYIFDLIRLVWYLGIDYDAAISLITPIHIIITIFFTLLSPIISVYIFNKIYKKYGIRGY